MAELSSQIWTVDTYDEGQEFFHNKGWTDGLPVVLPTKEKVEEFLGAAGLAPDEVIGEIPERNRVITAEKAAINAVMAGCRADYFPVVVAAVRGVTAPEFEFNHLASMGSPWPVLIISGPAVTRLDLNHQAWMLGPSARANAAIGRAFSLILWNLAELRPTGVQRGTYGNPLRWNSGLIAEDPSIPNGESLREYLGHSRQESTVTVFSNCGTFTQPWIMKPDITETLQGIADAIVGGSGNFNRGVYTIVLAPPIVDRIKGSGMSLDDARTWLKEHTGRSLASLKRRGFPPAGDAHRLWGTKTAGEAGNTFYDNIVHGVTATEDHDTFIKLFGENPGMDELIFSESQLGRENDIYFVTAGADASYGCIVLSEYDVSTNPVTVPIHFPGSE